MSFEIDPNKQYILAGDISASMQTPDPKCGGQSRYAYMLEKFQAFIQASQDFDPDGPTVLLFGEKVHVYENTTLDAVRTNLVNPTFEGFTNTADVIAKAYQLKQASGQPTVVLVFTDGAPTNRNALQRTITEIANAIEKDEDFSISFLTVGTIEPDLQVYLSKLDDELKGVKFDIVDVKALEEVDFLAAVKGAISD